MNGVISSEPKRKLSLGDWLKTLTFYELLVGMKATLTHLLNYKPITLQYPHEKRILPDNYRGMLALLRYDDGTEKCVGCDLCEAACPSRVIRVVSAEVLGKRHKVDVRRIQHQFDRQQDHDDVASNQHPNHAGEKHEPAQDQIVG